MQTHLQLQTVYANTEGGSLNHLIGRIIIITTILANYGRLALSFFRLSSLFDVLATDPRLNMPKVR